MKLLNDVPPGQWVETVPGVEGYEGRWHYKTPEPIMLFGVPVHVVAIAVDRQADYEEQRALNVMWEDELERLYATVEPSGPFETTKIEGHEAVIYLTPCGK